MFNTMKRKMFFRLTAICLIAVSALIACTKDYGSDIKELQNKVDGLSQQVSDLNALIKDGKVITSVKPEGNGTRVTFSNGDSFLISNGEDGEDGKDGTVWEIRDDYWWFDNGQGFQNSGKKAKGDPGKDADVWTIGSNGNWFCNGTDTGNPSKGADGKSAFEIAKANNPAVANMTEEEWVASLKGDKGDPGDYFVPCTDKTSEDYGKWIKVDGTDPTKRTTLEERWLDADALTAVWNKEDNTLSFHNIKGQEVVSISLAVGLNSIAVIPEVWDATLGMPTAQVYALYPTIKEFERIINGNGWNKLFMWNGANEANGDWGSEKYYDRNIWSAGGIAGFATMLWNSYLGATHQTNVNGYWDYWDINSPNFFRNCEWNEALLGPDPENYTWGAGGSGTHWDQTYEALVELFNNHFLDKLSERLADVSEAGQDSYSRQIPVSDLNFKYRLNPAGADVSGYTFKMLDRSVKALTKAEGENRNYAVVLDEPEFIGDDQVNIKGYVNYFKFWSEMPVEWMVKLLGAKVVRAWDVYAWKNDAPTADGNSWKSEIEEGFAIAGNFYKREDFSNISKWLEANGVSFQTIVALEASKDGQGEGAVVSDWASVKMEFVSPYWTAFDHHFPTQPTARWKVPHNLYNWWKGGLDYNGTGMAYENDLMKVSDSYNVAEHMRFADPYYGKLENLGFDVRYDYYLFCPETNATPHAGVNAQTGDVNLGTGEQVYDEDGNIVSGVYGGQTQDWGVYEYVDVDRTTGVVTVKEDYRSGANLAKVIGKFVFITADASIYNHATDTWYNSGATGYPGGNVARNNGTGQELAGFAGLLMYDEFAAQYCLQIIPDDNEGVEVTIDLGDIDYLALSTDKTAPAKDALDAVHMDLDTFSKIYGEPTVIGGTPAGYTGNYQKGSNDMFAITFDNAVALGAGAIKYCFTPSDTEIYPILTYNIKWNVTIDWTALEPVLNPDYILYKKDADGNKTNELEPTDIVPDPVESYDLARPEGNFPYVDTIILVKGKRVDGGWAPQASIRENLYKYGKDIDNAPNVEDIAMSINYEVSGKDESDAEIFDGPAISGLSSPFTYKTQEIRQLTPFDDELSRDYVIDIEVTLANGTSKVVKAYILRFVCPMYIKLVDENPDDETGDVDLYTHRTGWCSDRSEFEIRETGTDELLVSFGYREIFVPRVGMVPVIIKRVTSYAEDTYGRSFFNRIGNAVWSAEGDDTFGNNLRYESTTGWFYWNNNGNDLQEPKTLPYTVEVDIENLATIKADGWVYIHKTADSPAAHNMEEGHPDERVPSDDAIPLPTYEIEFED